MGISNKRGTDYEPDEYEVMKRDRIQEFEEKARAFHRINELFSDIKESKKDYYASFQKFISYDEQLIGHFIDEDKAEKYRDLLKKAKSIEEY